MISNKISGPLEEDKIREWQNKSLKSPLLCLLVCMSVYVFVFKYRVVQKNVVAQQIVCTYDRRQSMSFKLNLKCSECLYVCTGWSQRYLYCPTDCLEGKEVKDKESKSIRSALLHLVCLNL